MGRWTVEDGDQLVVIESTDDGQISLGCGCPQGPLITSGPEVMRELRSKLGLAIADAQGMR